jgi:RHS repeat-associated protein
MASSTPEKTMDRKAASRARTALLSAADASATLLSHSSAGALETFAYTSHGHRAGGSESSLPLGFNGELPAVLTGHYLLGNGYRAYNPVLMRFNSPDNLSPFERGGLNAYAYCEGDPVNNRDPSGHISGPRFWAARMAKAVAPRAAKISLQPRSLYQQAADSFTANAWQTVGRNAPVDLSGVLAGMQQRSGPDQLLPIMARSGVGLHAASFGLLTGFERGMLARLKATDTPFLKHAGRLDRVNSEIARYVRPTNDTVLDGIERWQAGRQTDLWLAEDPAVGDLFQDHSRPRSRLPEGVEAMYIRDPMGLIRRNPNVTQFR